MKWEQKKESNGFFIEKKAMRRANRTDKVNITFWSVGALTRKGSTYKIRLRSIIRNEGSCNKMG